MDTLKQIKEVDWKKKFSSVRNTVMNISPLEAKVREVTSNDPWGASSQDKQIVADHTHSFEEYRVVMGTLWKRMNDSGKNWRHVLKALQLLEYLIINGSDRVIDEARENIFSIRTLRNFRYVDEKGKDHGSGIRDLSRKLTELLKDEEEIIKLKRSAKKNKNKYAGISASDARYRMRRSRYESRSRYDDDDRRESPSSASNDDGDDEDREYRRRRDSVDSGGRRRNDASDEDSYDRRSRRSREGDVSGFRPRASASTSSTRSDEEPVTRIRAPSFGSGATQVNLDASASARQQPAVQETNIFDVTDFFDAPQQPVTAPSARQTSNNGISGRGMDQFNPRGVTSSQPSQQSSEWSPNFDGSDNNAFGDDTWGPAPGAASAITTSQSNKPTARDSGFGFDDAFPTDDDFTTFQPGEMEEKKPDLWDMTKDLVQLDLGGGKQNQQPYQQQQQQHNAHASSQKMSLKDMQKKQGGGGSMNRPAPSSFGMHPTASTVAPYGVPHGFVQPQMAGYGYGGQPYHPQAFGQQGMMPPMMGYGQQMGYINQGMQQQQQQQSPMGHPNQAPPPASQPNKSNSIDDLFF